jgi:hypothetical protein
MRERTTSRVMAADRPYDGFYDFYSVSPEYFEQRLVLGNIRMANLVRRRICVWLVSVTVFMYIDGQLLVPRRIKWRHGGVCGWDEGWVGGSGCTTVVGACQ